MSGPLARDDRQHQRVDQPSPLSRSLSPTGRDQRVYRSSWVLRKRGGHWLRIATILRLWPGPSPGRGLGDDPLDSSCSDPSGRPRPSWQITLYRQRQQAKRQQTATPSGSAGGGVAQPPQRKSVSSCTTGRSAPPWRVNARVTVTCAVVVLATACLRNGGEASAYHSRRELVALERGAKWQVLAMSGWVDEPFSSSCRWIQPVVPAET